MGVLNVTPDSFYDGGRFLQEKKIVEQAEKMLNEGAALLDVGGYSSRPGASEVPLGEELTRVVAAVKAIKKNFPQSIISIDTFRSVVAKAAYDEGAQLINDISGGSLDEAMFKTVAELDVPYVCMHMRGNPSTMNSMASYDNLLFEVVTYFHKKIYAMQSAGIKDIIIDPGFGFAKTVKQNFQLLNGLDHFRIFQKPLLVGLSRKSMIWKTLSTDPEQALNGTTALNMAALMKGANILRVHDVKEAVETIKLFSRIAQPAVGV